MRTAGARRLLRAAGAAVLAACLSPAQAAGPAMYAAAAAAEARPLPAAQRLERHLLQRAAAHQRLQWEASRLALARSGNPAVKDLANALLAHQQRTEPELLRLLHVRGMALPIMDSADARLLKQLGKLDRSRFDRMYVDEAVLRSTQDDIGVHEKLAAQAQDPVLR